MARVAAAVGLAGILLLHIPLARAVRVPRIDGIREVTSYVSGLANDQFVFYSGVYDGAFVYYLRAHDEHFSRGIVRSSKLLYATKIEPRFGLLERLQSASDVTLALREGCGCRYLVIEREFDGTVATEKYLRTALNDGQFRLVRTFPVEMPTVRHIDVYELLNTGVIPETFEFTFPVLGDGVSYRVRPVNQ